MLPFRSARVAAITAGLVGVLVYGNSVGNGFALDDVPILVEDQSKQDLSNLPEEVASPYWGQRTGRLSGIWRPITTAVLMVEWALWEDTTWPYHAVNMVLHGGVTVLVTLLLAGLIPIGGAFVGGLVFAVHPVHVEAVANVVGVAELLAALSMLGAFLIYADSGDSPGVGGRLGGGAATAIAALFALAFLTKESAIVLPGLFVLFDAWNERLTVRDLPDYVRRRGSFLVVLAAIAAAILLIRLQVLGSVARTVPPLGADVLAEIPRIWTLPVIWLHYLRLLVFPEDLSPDYTPGVIEVQFGWNLVNVAGIVASLAILGLAWAVWREDENPNPVTLGILWFGLSVLPVANVFFLSEILVAERTLYLPSVGLALVVGTLATLGAARSVRMTSTITGLVLVLMTVRTWTATPVWHDSGSVMNHLLAEHPESGRVQWMWADVMFDQANDREAGLEAYRRALGATGGTYAITDGAVGHLMEMGAYESAARVARLMWDARPDDPTGPARLALALFNLRRYRELVEPARVALEWTPDSSILHHLLAVGYRAQGDWEMALRHRRAAIRHGEARRWQQWRSLAELYMEVGNRSEAIASLDSARARSPQPQILQELDSLREAWSTSSPAADRISAEGPASR